MATVHGDVYARRERLCKRQGTPEIKQPVGAAKFVWDHRAGQHDGLPVDSGRLHRTGGHSHRVGAVSDHYAPLRHTAALRDNDLAIAVRHLQAIDHHQRADFDLELAAPEIEHLGKMRIFEVQPPVDLVILLIKGPAGDENANRVAQAPCPRCRDLTNAATSRPNERVSIGLRM